MVFSTCLTYIIIPAGLTDVLQGRAAVTYAILGCSTGVG